MTDDLTGLLRVAEQIEHGQTLTGDLFTAERVPVPIRMLVAAVALTAADRPVNAKAITTTALAARSAIYRDHTALLRGLIDHLPALVSAQLGSPTGIGDNGSVTSLRSQLDAANRTIAEEREKRRVAELRLANVGSYARQLHERLQPEFERDIRLRIQEQAINLTG